jgi:UDP-N-acetylglucosamine diphosphorylase / glucose-1-phosphate thymidylyltransferase / UDP-N-acetylgalactosamine diphosphorylase / glucosamine-1-phosphate N-acetyltransferase / galactosamine-1-phosphate N-acetyltransferase
LVMNGDIVARAVDIGKLKDAETTTLILTEAGNPSDLGAVETKDGKIVKIQEKIPGPSSRLVSTGIYLLTSHIFPAIASCPASPRGEYDLTDALQCLIDSGHPVKYYTTDYWFNPDYPWNLLEAHESFMSGVRARNPGEMDDNVTLKGKFAVGKGTQIKAGTYIEGPVIIGEQCHIGPCCYLKSGTAIGNGCQIDGSVEIKNSIIMHNTKIFNHSYIGDSIIGEDCLIGAGTRTANVRFDGSSVKVAGITTGRKEFGAVIGDRVQTGVNVSIDAGTLIGNESILGPGSAARGVILPKSKIY